MNEIKVFPLLLMWSFKLEDPTSDLFPFTFKKDKMNLVGNMCL
jgi:hypothetical protein